MKLKLFALLLLLGLTAAACVLMGIRLHTMTFAYEHAARGAEQMIQSHVILGNGVQALLLEHDSTKFWKLWHEAADSSDVGWPNQSKAWQAVERYNRSWCGMFWRITETP